MVFGILGHPLSGVITFTIWYSRRCSRRETVLLSVVAAVHLLLHGSFLNIAYLIIFPAYGLLFSSCRGFLSRHPGCIPFYGAFFSFLTGQLVDLPFLLLSDTVTVLYMIMGLKTSLIQGCLTFLTLLFLFEPIKKVLLQIERRMMR
ncbi:MAG: cytochrome B [Merdibacter sp.]